MPKQYNIKWRDSDKAKIAKTVKRYNAKRARLIKTVPELEDILPKKVSVKDLKKDIKTRNDFNKTINRLERFLRKGAEQNVVTASGVRTTKYQIKENQILIRQINAQRAREAKKANPSTYKGTMGRVKDMNLRPKSDNTQNIPKERWDDFVESLEKQSLDSYYQWRSEIYKENYLTAIYKELGPGGKPIFDLLNLMTPEDVLNAYYAEPDLEIAFAYSKEEQRIRIDVIFTTLVDYIDQHDIELSDENNVDINKIYERVKKDELDKRLRDINKY